MCVMSCQACVAVERSIDRGLILGGLVDVAFNWNFSFPPAPPMHVVRYLLAGWGWGLGVGGTVVFTSCGWNQRSWGHGILKAEKKVGEQNTVVPKRIWRPTPFFFECPPPPQSFIKTVHKFWCWCSYFLYGKFPSLTWNLPNYTVLKTNVANAPWK